MSESNKVVFQNIIMAIDEAIKSEVGEEREYSDQTDQILDDLQTTLKEALDLPADFYL